ncbi:hypothetical protein C8Q77DRAFT_1159506 [Trametes polyzona]|nr:hypothetical protein C8Q77DRAFT_1159506 [Trametes polyzona]
MGTFPPECIPRLGSFIAALSASRMRHKPIAIHQTPHATKPMLDVVHAQCRLASAAQLTTLQWLFDVPDLTEYDIEVPEFGPERLRAIRADHLKTDLTVRGELPSVFQFLCALEAKALSELHIHFYRSQYASFVLCGEQDFAFSLNLPPSAYGSLVKVVLRENEEHPRWTYISLGMALRPLFTLCTLEDVEVQLEQSFMHAPDRDIVQLSLAWRRLRRLILRCTRLSRDKIPTLDSLFALADNCRRLEMLLLPALDLENLGTHIETRVLREPWQHELAHLHPLRLFGVMCGTRVATGMPDARAVVIARWMDCLFPNIDVEASWEHDGSVEAILADWYSVWLNVVTIKALRRHAPGRAYTDIQAYLD